MIKITLDASAWKGVSDFYREIFAALRAPEWHGDNVNALVESIVWGEINELEPPYRIEVVNSHAAPAPIRQELQWTEEDVRSAKADRKRRQGVEPDVWFEVRS